MQKLFPEINAVESIHSQEITFMLSSQLLLLHYPQNDRLNIQLFNLNKIKRHPFNEEHNEKITLNYLHQRSRQIIQYRIALNHIFS